MQPLQVSFCFALKTTQKLWLQVSFCFTLNTTQKLWLQVTLCFAWRQLRNCGSKSLALWCQGHFCKYGSDTCRFHASADCCVHSMDTFCSKHYTNPEEVYCCIAFWESTASSKTFFDKACGRGLFVDSIFIPYSEGAQASQTNFNYSKISFPFYKYCRIFCEGEWEQIIKRDGIAIINKNNRNNIQLLVFGPHHSLWPQHGLQPHHSLWPHHDLHLQQAYWANWHFWPYWLCWPHRL